MLIVETIGRIRRQHLVKGKSIKEIARDLNISRNTARKVLRSGETSFSYEREVQPRPKLGRWKVEIDRLLTGNVEKTAPKALRSPPFAVLRQQADPPHQNAAIRAAAAKNNALATCQILCAEVLLPPCHPFTASA